MDFPSSLKYTADHEWIEISGKSAKVGVSTFAVEQLGDIVHVDLPKVGQTFDTGAAFGTIESTKTVSDLYMPVAGKIVEVNAAVASAPESIQADPYKNGWLVKIELTGTPNLSHLLDAGAYAKIVQEQA